MSAPSFLLKIVQMLMFFNTLVKELSLTYYYRRNPKFACPLWRTKTTKKKIFEQIADGAVRTQPNVPAWITEKRGKNCRLNGNTDDYIPTHLSFLISGKCTSADGGFDVL